MKIFLGKGCANGSGKRTITVNTTKMLPFTFTA